MFRFDSTSIGVVVSCNRVTAILKSGALGFALLLAGCGGGGGSAGSDPVAQAPQAPQTPATQEAFQRPADWQTDPDIWASDPEFQNQAGLNAINAQDAYARGVTGAGQVIGFVDTGLDETHIEFAGKNIRLNDRSGLHEADNPQLSHGTAVASVALGARGYGDGLHGVAFDADPAFWSLFLDQRGSLSVNDEILTNAINALEGTGARIINQSWGYATPLDTGLLNTQKRFLEYNYANTLAAMRRGNAIHVWAAGNTGAAHPAASTAWPIFFPELAGLSLNVVALGADGLIGRDSNRCGDAYQHCIAAPGGVAAGGSAYTQLARAGGGYRRGFGTSYAAPFVSGALALMMQAFGDQLTLQEYTGRLFASANKSGAYASDAIYGQGLLDIDAALQPIGELGIPLPTGGIARPAESNIRGGLLPEEMLERLRNEPVVILDELRTPFVTPLVVTPDKHQNFNLTKWLTHGDGETGPSSHPFLAQLDARNTGAAQGFWQLVPIALRKTGVRRDLPGPGSIGFAAITTRRRGRFQLGVLGEGEGLLSSVGSGALSLGPSQTALLSFGQSFDISKRLVIEADAHFTFSHLNGLQNSLVLGAEGAVASAFDIGVNYGKLKALISQPTYFESGELNLRLPYRRLQSGAVQFEDTDIALRGATRPLSLSLTYQHRLGSFGLRADKLSDAPTHFGFAWRYNY